MEQQKLGLAIKTASLERIGNGFTVRYYIYNDKDYKSVQDTKFVPSLKAALKFISELENEVQAEILAIEAPSQEF